ncbi:MAG TPA: TIGR01777 family oxidoreductase [Actinomycetota bacterium]|nr:TIGR01777 family oxidoreductase [Actinomycetota bacterium]
MDVAVTGSSGLIGAALVTALEAAGDRVVRLVRSGPARPGTIRWDPAAGAIDAAGLEGIDAVVHLAGESIGAARWTAAKKARILNSRVDGTSLLAATISDLRSPPRVLVSGSAIGFYGDRGDELLTEGSGPGTGFLAGVVRRWEDAARPAAEAGVRVVTLRSGIVLSPRGGVLGTMLVPFRLGLGGRLGSGRQWTSWITLDDEVAAIVHALRHEPLSGPVNAVAPNPVTNAELTATLGRVLHRPTVAAVPPVALRAALGADAARELLGSQRVAPDALARSGFRFGDPELEAALRRLLARPAASAPPYP